MGYEAGKTYPAETLTPEEVKKIMRAFRARKTDVGVRDYAIVMLMVGAGLRVDEALKLGNRDLRPDEGWVCIMHGKGNKDRRAAVPLDVWKAIEKWVRIRKNLDVPDDAPLFCTLPRTDRDYSGGRKIHRENFRKIFKRVVKKAGVAWAHCHALRHTCAVDLVKDDWKPHEIQRQFGHSSLKRTQVYLDHLCPEELAEKMSRRVWVYG